LVAMGAVFGAAARAPFSFIIFVFAITRDYNSALVTVLADGIALRLMPRSSIMTEKLERRRLHIHQDDEADGLEPVNVSETRDSECRSSPRICRWGTGRGRIARQEPEVSLHQALVILDPDSKLAGIITRGDLLRALARDPTGTMTVLEARTRDVIVTDPDEVLHLAAAQMLGNHIGRLPVVE
jgi:CIC family chloride channel protein